MADITIPKGELPKAPMVAFINDHLPKGEAVVSASTPWPVLVDKLTEYKLWHDSGEVWEKLGLVLPFDARVFKGILKYKQAFDSRGGMNGSGDRCRDLESMFERLAAAGDCALSESDSETGELTAQESFDLCTAGENHGTCSEIAYKKAMLGHLLAPECDPIIGVWFAHIDTIFGTPDLSRLRGLSIINAGALFMDGDLEDLFVAYYCSLSVIYMRRGDIDDAEGIINMALSLSPDNRSLMSGLGAIYLERARQILSQINEGTGEGERTTLIARTKTYMTKAQEIAERLIGKGEEGKLNKAYGLTLLIGLYHMEVFLGERAVDDIFKLVEDAIYLNPNDYYAYYMVGRLKLEQGDMSGLEMLRIAQRLALDEIIRQEIEEVIGKTEEHIHALISNMELQLTRNSNISEQEKMDLYLELADSNLMLKKYSEAEKYYRLALELTTNPEIKEQIFASLVYSIKSQSDDSSYRIALTRMVTENPEVMVLKVELARIYVESMEFDKAMTIIQGLEQSSVQKDQINYYLLLGNLFSMQAKYGESLIYIQKALEIDPNNFEARYALASMQILFGEYDEARGILNTLRREDPLNFGIHSQLGHLSLNTLDVTDFYMWSSFIKSVDVGGDFSDQLSQDVGFMSLYQGEYDRAEELFRKGMVTSLNSINHEAGLTIALFMQNKPEWKEMLRRLINHKGADKDEKLYFILGWIAEAYVEDGNSAFRESAIRFYQISASIMPGWGYTMHRLKELGASPVSREVTYDDYLDAREFAEELLGEEL